MKTCTNCKHDKAPDQFAIDRSKRDGRDSWCRDCRNKARKGRYYAKHEHEKRRGRSYYAANRESASAARRRYHQEHREEINAASRGRLRPRRNKNHRDAEQERIRYMRRHGGIDEWARLYESQNGLCYLCGQTLEGVPQRLIAVDHDHDCCPGGKVTESCSACRRGPRARLV